MSVAASLMLAACGTDVPTEPRREPEVEPQPERVIWRVEGRGVNKVPSADATTVYFGTVDHELLAIDKLNGSVRWRRSTGDTSPVNWECRLW